MAIRHSIFTQVHPLLLQDLAQNLSSFLSDKLNSTRFQLESTMLAVSRCTSCFFLALFLVFIDIALVLALLFLRYISQSCKEPGGCCLYHLQLPIPHLHSIKHAVHDFFILPDPLSDRELSDLFHFHDHAVSYPISLVTESIIYSS